VREELLKNGKRPKRAIALAGRGSVAGLHIGALRYFKSVGIEFDVWALSGIGAWVGIIYNQAEEGREVEQTYEFFRNNVFRDDAIYESFPFNAICTPDLFGTAHALTKFALQPESYRSLLLPKHIFSALANGLSVLSGRRGKWSEGDLNRSLFNDVLAVNPFTRLWTSAMLKSEIEGLARTHYPDSSLFKKINFDRLYDEGKPYILHNAWNLSQQKLELFSNKGYPYRPISAASMCACSSLFYFDQPVEIDGDEYCGGSMVDTVNFKTLLQDHPDLDEIWIMRFTPGHIYPQPRNLHEAAAFLSQLYEAHIADGDNELFKYHVMKDDKWHGRIVEMTINSKVTGAENRTNLERGVERGARAALEASRSYSASRQAEESSPSFYFALDGKDARGDEVVYGAIFDLVFNYSSPPPDVLAILEGDKFKEAVRTDAVLGITVIPNGGLSLIDGEALCSVSFKDGKMLGEPPRFHLQAPAKSSNWLDDECGVYVVFSRDRAGIITSSRSV
jgi:predicted acylesterase/phospholipase RssA